MKLLALRLVLLSGVLGLCAWMSDRAYADFFWQQTPGPPFQKSMSKCKAASACVTDGCTNLPVPVSVTVSGGTVMAKSYHSRDPIAYGWCTGDATATCDQYPNVACSTVYVYTAQNCPENMNAGIKIVYSGNCTPP